ncbi:MAG: zinc ribbon domain-containing protein [Planctomycetota bacterium]|nr:zinc ribbon domain-containing protein [Planctomycetota bacterium]
MRVLTLGLCAAMLIGCGSTTSETYSRDPMTEIANYPPPPPDYKRVRVGIAEFDDKTGSEIGEQAGVQMETLAHRSKRFNVIDRTQLKTLLNEQGLEGIVDPAELAKPGRVRGVDYLFVGAITNFRVKTVKQKKGFDLGGLPIPGRGNRFSAVGVDTSKTTVETQVGVDIKLVNTTTGEIVAKDFGEVIRQDLASAWGMRILGSGGQASNDLKIDEDSKGKILRWALDESLKKMLPDIDERFSREELPVCPKCKTEVAAGKKFCQKCGTSVGPVACAECGAEMEPGSGFCGSCGVKVEKK